MENKASPSLKITSALERLSNGNLQITINISWPAVKKVYDQVLLDKAASVTIAGFRQGKAPLDLIVKTVGKQTLLRDTLQKILPEVYLQAIKDHQLKPIIQPKIQVLNMTEGQDWRLLTISAEMPKISLGNYQEEIKSALKEVKIWIPGKGEKENKSKKSSINDQLEKLFATLLKVTKVELPQILLEQEVNRLLANLLEQIEKLGLTLEAYLSSLQKTVEQLRQEYQERAEKSLKIDFVLAAIADDLKIKVEEKEINELIDKSVKNEKEKEKISANKYYFASLLRRQKTLDKLLSL